MRGYLTTETAARLNGQIKVGRPPGSDRHGGRLGQPRRSPQRGVPEGVGYAERQRIGYDLVRALVDDLDAGLMANLRESFGALIRP